LKALDEPLAVVLNRILFLEGRRIGIDLTLLPLVQCLELIVGEDKVKLSLPLVFIAGPVVLLVVLADRVEAEGVEDIVNEIPMEERPGLGNKCPDFSARVEDNRLLESLIKDSGLVPAVPLV
jgi:hypothetical protein